MSKPGCLVTEGYRLPKPVGTKVTHLLYVDDLKAFASKQGTTINQYRDAGYGLAVEPKEVQRYLCQKGLAS